MLSQREHYCHLKNTANLKKTTGGFECRSERSERGGVVGFSSETFRYLSKTAIKKPEGYF
jgi:hypothetical protein